MEITQEQANEIVNKMMGKNPDEKIYHDLWFLGDMIDEMLYTKNDKANKRALIFLESLNQEDEDVKELRRYLKL